MSRVTINSGLLQMILNGLKRDVADGKIIRAEWIAEIENDIQPVMDQHSATNGNPCMEEDHISEVLRMVNEIADYAWKEGLSDWCYQSAIHDRESKEESIIELGVYLRGDTYDGK